MNLNEGGESTPVNVRIYALREQRRFLEVPFEDLWLKAKEVLEEDWLASPRIVTVLPGSPEDDPQEVDLEDLNSSARYIGVMALFGQGAPGKRRRRVVSLEECSGTIFELRGYAVSLNRDEQLDALDGTTAVEVRVVQLKDDKRFLDVDFDDLRNKTKSTLGEDLLGAPVSATVHPGKTGEALPSVAVGKLPVAARFLGVTAFLTVKGREEKRRKVFRTGERSEFLFELYGTGIILKAERE
jgi:type VI secretion system VasD/TssJ family lipoprotein